jgi:hypothetical protein
VLVTAAYVRELIYDTPLLAAEKNVETYRRLFFRAVRLGPSSPIDNVVIHSQESEMSNRIAPPHNLHSVAKTAQQHN